MNAMELISTLGESLPGSAAPPAPSAPLLAGHRVHEYEIQRLLGGGGFGLTYLARDVHLDLRVALKEYFPAELAQRSAHGRVGPWTDDPLHHQRFEEGLTRFLEEARVLAALKHPHIVRVLRCFRAQGTAYIVMEYEAGWPLRRWAGRARPSPGTGLARLAPALFDALEAVHAAGFLHRDLKPDNILVRPCATPVLLDFGAAGRVGVQQAGCAVASPGFSAPEQYNAPGRQGPWTDIYGLGAVMYWLVTGRRPIEATQRLGADPQPRAESIAPPGQHPVELLRLIDRCLDPDVRERPQSVAELRGTFMAATATPSHPSSAAGRPCPGGLMAPADTRARTALAAVLFIDLVGQSLLPMEVQVAAKSLLDRWLGSALEAVPPDSRLALDTGDGVVLCFFGDPRDALGTALRMRQTLGEPPRTLLAVRMGLHVGPVRLVRDINQRTNVIGDGINAACRIMDFAEPGEILASRAFCRAIERLGQPGMFTAARSYRDKHGRTHEALPLVAGGPAQALFADRAGIGGLADGTAHVPTRPLHELSSTAPIAP